LFLGTRADNNRDAYNKGRLALNAINDSGEPTYKKVDDELISKFQLLYAFGISQARIAKMHNVSQSLVSIYVRGS